MSEYNNIEKYNNLWDLYVGSIEKFKEREIYTYKRGLAKVSSTYEEELTRTKKVANFLTKLGVSRGDKIILYVQTSPYWIEIFFASALLGAVVVPIDMDSPKEMIDQIIRETTPKLIVHSKNQQLDFNINSFFIDEIDEHIENLNVIKTRDYLKKIDPDDVVEILYTSGTTGNPKGVMLSHKNLTTNLYNVLLIFPIRDFLSILQVLPLSHSYAQILTYGIIVLGGKINFLKKVNAFEIKSVLKENYVNALPVVPLFLNSIKEGIEGKFRRFRVLFILNALQRFASFSNSKKFKKILFGFIHKELGGNIELITSAGAPLAPHVFQWWDNLGVDIYKGYGATETGPVLTFEDKDNPDPVSVGKPLPNQMLKIEDDEVLAKGDHVTKGYYKNKEATGKAFNSDGWYKTGDLGFMKKGKVYLNGRKKDMIVLANGKNVFPVDIEDHFLRINGIDDCVVLGMEINDDIELVTVFLTQKDSSELEKLVKKFNSKSKSDFTIRHIIKWDKSDFPRTHTKKVKRNKVLEHVENQIKNITPKQKEPKKKISGNEAETIINTLVEILNIDENQISDESNLAMDLGMDSLARADLVSTVGERYSKEILEEDIDNSSTVEDLIELYKKAGPYEGISKIKTSSWSSSKALAVFREIFIFPILRLLLIPFFNINKKSVEFDDRNRLIIANHRSNLDGFILFLMLPRKIRLNSVMLIAGDIWDRTYFKPFKFLLTFFIPIYSINRFGSANKSLEITAYFLNKNKNVFLFPEGTVNFDYKKTGVIFRKGAAKILHDFRIPVTSVKSRGLDVIHRRLLLPTPKNHKLDIIIENNSINYLTSVDEINSQLEESFKGF